jgi:hypothetical protein
MNAEAKKPEPLLITSANCMSIMTYLKENHRDHWGRLVMDMFMRITELEIEARIRAEMKPPRPTGMRGARPLGYWPDEAKEFVRSGGRQSEHDDTTPFNNPDELRATLGSFNGAVIRQIERIAAERSCCYDCAFLFARDGEAPLVCNVCSRPGGEDVSDAPKES